jgi:hypothetical protein
MKKSILFLSVLVLMVTTTGCGQKAAVVNTEDEQENGSECSNLCAQIEEICPDFLASKRCNSECESWDQEAMEKIRQASTCQELFVIPEIVSASAPEVMEIPELNDPELEEPASECEAACNNYVNQCLTLVPNATQALFQEGLSSCLEECAGWEETKVRCIKQAADCPSMTEVCGL